MMYLATAGRNHRLEREEEYTGKFSDPFMDPDYGNGSYSIYLWNAETYERAGKLKGHRNDVNCLSFSFDNTRLVSASEDWTAKVWDVNSRSVVITLKHGNRVRGAHFNRAGDKLITTSEHGSVKLWDLATQARLISVGFTNYAVGLLNFDETKIACPVAYGEQGDTCYDEPFQLRVWDSSTGAETLRIEKSRSEMAQMWSMAMSPTEDTVACGGQDGDITLFDLTTGAVKKVLVGHTSMVNCLCYSPDGTRLFSGSMDKRARVWDVAKGKKIKVINCLNEVTSMSFQPTLNRLICGRQSGFARVYDATTGDVKMRFDGLDIRCVAFSHTPVPL
jgi:WD40 repeat protein